MNVIIAIEEKFNIDDLNEIQIKNQNIYCIWDTNKILTNKDIQKINDKYPSFKIFDKLNLYKIKGDVFICSNIISNLLIAIKKFESYSEQNQESFDILVPLSNVILSKFGCNISETNNIDFCFDNWCYELTNVYFEKCFYLSRQYIQYISKDAEFSCIKALYAFVENTTVAHAGVLLTTCVIYKRNVLDYDIKEIEFFNLLQLISIRYLTAIKQNILYLIHADFHPQAINNIGGTQFHLRDLVNNLKYTYDVFVLSKDKNGFRLSVYINNWSKSIELYIPGPTIQRKMYNNKYKNIFSFILDFFHINLIHVHHTMDLSIEIYRQAMTKNIPIFLTAHDYYYLCPKINMSCNEIPNQVICNPCIEKTFGLSEQYNYWKQWNDHTNEILRICKNVFMPSKSALQIYQKCFPQYEEKFLIIEHGISKTNIENIPLLERKMVNVAFLGGLTKEKGSQLIKKIVEMDAPHINWHIFGGIDDSELLNFSKDNLHKHGWYDQKNITQLLIENKIHLVCILSLCRETYCYTLTEALLAGIPTIVTPYGALEERVKKLDCGWVLEKEDCNAKGVLKCIESIIDNPDHYVRKCKNIKQIKFPTIEDMSLSYKEIYERFFCKNETKVRTVNLSDILSFTHQMVPNKTVVSQQDLNEILRFRDQILNIKNSKIWKLYLKMKKIKNKFNM